ncbi:MAG: ribbon-helix-helix domain-containing protein [Chloroflexota bacterium]
MENTSQVVWTRLPKNTVEKLDAVCAATGDSRASVIRRALVSAVPGLLADAKAYIEHVAEVEKQIATGHSGPVTTR